MPTITFSGLASGLDTASWIDALVSVKQLTVTSLKETLKTYEDKQATVTELQTSFSSLRTAIEKLTDAKFGANLDIFANNMVTSSNEDIFTATVTKNAARQVYDIKVEQLATKTTVSADRAVSAVANDDTKLSDMGITEGTLTAYVDGVKHTINIGADDTVQDLRTRFAEAGIKAEIDEEGMFNLSAQNGTSEILIGATTDTSNLRSLYGIARQEDGTYKSTSSMYQVTTASKVMESGIFATEDNPNASITAGTFTIGEAEFTIDENTTISSLVSAINSNEDAGATAYWDATNAKLVLTSTVEGQSYVNVEAGTSNFTDVMGFTTSEWDGEGNLVKTALNTDNQTLGENAILYVNGTQVISSSNTVTSDISRLEGVTLNLKGVSTEEEPTSTMTVEQDSTEIVEALTDFVDQYNELMTKIDELTATDGDLHGDTTLKQIKNSMRQLVTTTTGQEGDVYKMLSQIGISTAAAGADLSADTSSLTLDEDKLKQVLAEDPDAVKKVIMGTSSDGYGILSQLESVIENSLATNGYFSTTIDSLQSNMTRYNEKITRANEQVANYKSRLEAQFQAMENTISNMQSAYSGLLSS